MSNLFFRNPRLTILTLGLIAVAGLAAFQALPRQEDPTLSRRMGIVTTFYAGASASRVESMVTEKIETELQELFEIKVVESTSRTGVSVIFVELQDRFVEADVDEIWSKVRDRLGDAAAVMPPGATAPELEEKTTIAATLVTALLWEGEGEPQLDLLTRLADDLEQQLRNVSGTRETEIYGPAREEIRVTVDDAALSSLGLTAGDVARAIARADAKVPAGQLRHGSNDILFEVAGALDSLDRIRRIPLLQRADGQVLHLSHVARVEKTVQDPPETIALVSGQQGVVVSTTMESNLRVDLWSARARSRIDAFEAELPDGVTLRVIFDQSIYTDERLGALAGNLFIAAAIVIAVLFFMMGARSAMIVGLALPLTLALVLAELKWIGMPLHQTSVTGLIIALGLLIDNAIVVVDDYRAELREGHAPAAAISRAVRHLFVPLAASTLTTVLAFLPIVLMPGGGGEFVGPIAVGVVLSVSTSFAIAMTVIPSVAGYVITEERDHDVRRWWRDGYSNEKLTALYRRSLGVTLRRPSVGVGVSLILPILGFVVVGSLPEMFFPPNDRNQFQLQMNLPSQSSIEETRRNAERAREIVHGHAEVVDSHWFLGEAAPRVYYNMMGNNDGMSSYAGAFVTTRSADATEALLPDLQLELMEAFPNAVVLALPFEQGPPFAAPIEVRIVGPDLDVLREAGDQLRGIMAETRGVTYTDAALTGGRPKLLLVPDEDEARLAGLRLVDIAEQLNASLEGITGGSVLESTEEIPVRVRTSGSQRGDLSRIASHSLQPSTPAPSPMSSSSLPGVPLSVLSKVQLVPELAGIPHRDGQRVNTVQGFLMPYTLIAESLKEFRERLDASDFALPPGYRLQLGGETEQRSEAIGNLMLFAGPLLVLMLGTIILSFNSFRFAAVIVVVAVLSVGLAFIGVWLFGHPMGFLAVVGTMGLVGLAINGGIVVLSALKASPAAMAADVEATREVVIGATRHILGTTLTTVGGFVPLIVFGGRFWPPMATAIAGGVGGSAILSLYLVPSLFMVIARQRTRRAARLEGAPQQPHSVEQTRSAA